MICVLIVALELVINVYFITTFRKEVNKKKKWFGKEKPLVSDFPNLETIQVPHPPLEDVEVEVKNEQTEHAYSVAIATAAAAAQAAAEVVPHTTATQFTGKSKRGGGSNQNPDCFLWLPGMLLNKLTFLPQLDLMGWTSKFVRVEKI